MTSSFEAAGLETEKIRRLWGESLDGGFVVLPNVVFQDQAELGLNCEHTVLLANLALHRWDDGRHPYPSTETLARRTGLSRRTVQRRLAELEEKGFVERTWSDSPEASLRRTAFDMSGLVGKLKPLGVKAREKREQREELRKSRLGATQTGQPAQ